MVNPKLLYILNVFTAITFVICVISIDMGPRDIHEISGNWFIALAIIHSLMHWNWFVCMTKNIFKKK